MGIDWEEIYGVDDIGDDDWNDDNFVPAKNRVIKPLGDNDFLIFEDDAPADDQAFLDEWFHSDDEYEGMPHDMLEEAFLYDAPCKKTDLINMFHHDHEQIIVFLEAVSALELYVEEVGMKSGITFQGDEYIGVYVEPNNYYKFVVYPLLKTIEFHDGKTFLLSFQERKDIHNEVIKKVRP